LAHSDRLRGVCRVEVDTTGRGAKAQMKSANTRKARIVLIAGSDEVVAGEFQLKNLDTGHQEAVAQDSVLAAVREVLEGE
jgi:histidyl-tRNA synthetase